MNVFWMFKTVYLKTFLGSTEQTIAINQLSNMERGRNRYVDLQMYSSQVVQIRW